MLDSVRLRLTVWYTAAVAVVLILLACLTYFLYARNIAQRTDSNLVELTDAFTTTFNAELPAEICSDAPQKRRAKPCWSTVSVALSSSSWMIEASHS